MKVVFVCSGNICRSAIAQAYFRRCAEAAGLSGTLVDSAGTLGIEGAPACAEAIALLGARGLDLSGHRSKGLRPETLHGADWVVVMEREHLDYLARHHPARGERRVLLRAFEHGAAAASDAEDLEDPFGGPLEGYLRQVPLILRCVDHFVEHLRGT